MRVIVDIDVEKIHGPHHLNEKVAKTLTAMVFAEIVGNPLEFEVNGTDYEVTNVRLRSWTDS
jgi:hypothetical protein